MTFYILCGLLILASIIDFKTLKIPNILTGTGLILGVGLSFYVNGLNGLKVSLIGFLLIGIIMFSVWAITTTLGTKLFGAGDVKLYMVIGSFVGFENTLDIIYLSIIIGGILIVFRMKPTRIIEIFKDFFYLAYYFVPFPSDSKLKKMSFAFPIFIAVIVKELKIM